MCVYLIAADAPTGLMAVEASPTSIQVSWTAPASGGASRTGYRISYQTGGSVQSVDVGAAATSQTLIGLQSGATYSISIVTLSSTLPSTAVGPETVTLEGDLCIPKGNMRFVYYHYITYFSPHPQFLPPLLLL